ncbi:hypothetical protein GGTG_05460 [Gaeumannomyces tritici R3-111a-1]|uniref:U3 small nucleolar RNA-associated protein 22 n=1 Tax=Gaeumannomyces tritici (strain R3-111a-1) TaxID=644352 RepID=J3NVZ7_GAET3|nr:hypothetical protein GGTG_05460 [Gaeumannomyces tritici R3-111a-1]EJT75527.1 hypothetical protein GGTG_05460 [Gaeumannomyces tritici R3-111a-1]
MDSSPAKRRKISESGASIPNGSVLEAAASSAGVYRPSPFILETEELLSEIKIDPSEALKGADQLLHKIKGAIETLDPHGPLPINDAVKRFENESGIRIPFPDPKPPKDSQYKLSLERPTVFNVVGSYVSKTMIKSQGDMAVDMVVEMPQGMFQEKDYLNLRYFYKRAYFLAHLAAQVRKELGLEVSFARLNDNPLVPALRVSAAQDTKDSARSKSGATVRIIPCAPDRLFPRNKLLSTSNAVRPPGGAEDKETTPAPTPFYNSTLKAEGLYFTYLKALRLTEKVSPAFKDACALGRVWLQQRGFGASISRGGFGHFEWSLLLSLLMQSNRRRKSGDQQSALSSALSSHQMFKAAIQFLAKADLADGSRKPVVLGKLGDVNIESVREPSPVLYDAARQLNFGFKMSPWSAAMLKRQAKWTLDVLNNSTVNQFTAAFITKADVPLQIFDLLVQVPCPSADEARTPGSQGGMFEFASRVHRILKRALTGRAQLIHIKLPEQRSWSPSKSPKLATESDTLLVGVIFDPAEMGRKVDHGPSAEEKAEARKYRQFWGERSELRRFKDGNIQETLIWTHDTPFGVCKEIVNYILKLHLKMDASELEFYGNGFTSLIHAKASDAAAYSTAREAFSTLERDIRSLEDLPLQVRHVAPAAPELRSSSVKAPQLDQPRAPYRPMDVVISFEVSSKWPDNIAAIQRTKVAFLLKIGDLLSSANSSITTHVGLEDAEHEHENLAFLDIVYDEGAVFRLRVHSDLEETLLDRQTKDKTLEQFARTESASFLATSRRRFTHLPLLNQTISTFCTRFPALSLTIRLVKHWFASHKLTNHFLPEVVELAALHAFMNPAPWQIPSGPVTGLLRTLMLLARWDWRDEPLIVDPSGDMDAAARQAVSARLTAWRRTLDPAMNRTVLLIATPADETGTAFTSADGRALPSRVAASRMTALARSACRLVRERDPAQLEPRMLFAPSLADYDVVLHLDGPTVKRLRAAGGGGGGDAGAAKSRFKNLDGSATGARPPLARDPVGALLGRLEDAYGAALVLFRGAADDLAVGGIWNPTVQRRSFRVNLPCSFRPVGSSSAAAAAAAAARKRKGDDRDVEVDSDDSYNSGDDDDVVEVNREAMLSEMARIGGDLIQSIEVKGS